MAAIMTAPMVIIELLFMGAMYDNKKLNAVLITVSSVFLIAFIVLLRKQVAIGDKEFLKSMIPHHGAAILMCEQASIEDPQVRQLCKDIITAQQSEIDFMKSKLMAMQ